MHAFAPTGEMLSATSQPYNAFSEQVVTHSQTWVAFLVLGMKPDVIVLVPWSPQTQCGRTKDCRQPR